MKEIIISRTDRIGDVILTTATFAPLRQRFPNAHIRVLAQPEIAPLLNGQKHVEPVACASGKGAKRMKSDRIRQWKRYFSDNPADCIVFLHPDNDLQIAAALAHIPRRIGYRKQMGGLALNETIPYRRHLGLKHEAACNFDLLTKIGCPEPKRIEPHLVAHESSPIIGEFAVFHTAAFGNKPRWPTKHFAALAEEIIEEFGWKIVLIGAEPEVETVEAFHEKGISASSWEDRCGKDNLEATAAILRNAQVVVSRDSGPAHLASALGTPLVCLMGQCDPIHSPRRWAPIGDRVETIISDLSALKGESREARWQRCFEAIHPDRVMAGIKSVYRQQS
ncbi:MAG: glycosyltransferase family 9 protein [Verrucomicrobiota bacterium]